MGPGKAEEFKGSGTTGNKESPSSKDPVAHSVVAHHCIRRSDTMEGLKDSLAASIPMAIVASMGTTQIANKSCVPRHWQRHIHYK